MDSPPKICKAPFLAHISIKIIKMNKINHSFTLFLFCFCLGAFDQEVFHLLQSTFSMKVHEFACECGLKIYSECGTILLSLTTCFFNKSKWTCLLETSLIINHLIIMVKDCSSLFIQSFRIRLITVGALTIHIHILKKVVNWLCLLIFPNNDKQKRWKRWKQWFIYYSFYSW